MKLPISVFIITKDEEDRIYRSIKSVIDWVDEVIIIDSGSTDNTVKIVEDLGIKVIFNEWPGFGPQKIFGESLCKNKWILNIDADEEVTDELRQNIEHLFKSGEPEQSAFKMYWKILFEYQQKPSLFATGSNFVRLYNKEKSGFRDSQIHDSVVIREGTMGEIKGYIWHRNFTSVKRWLKKNDSYTDKQAEDLFKKGRNPSLIRIIFEVPLTFLKAYFIRRNFIYGTNGFIFSILYSQSKFLRLAKTRELFEKEKYNKCPK